MIPKKIFQTHEYKYEDLPENFKQTSMSWQNINPGWEYIYYDKDQRENYVKIHGPELYFFYKRVGKMFQADIWRYLIIYKEGGVYADMDSFCTAPLDYILSNLPDNISMVVTEEEDNKHTNNANFASVKGSKIMKDVIISLLTSCSRDFDRDSAISEVNSMLERNIHVSFSDTIYKNKSHVSRNMQMISHSLDYKKPFYAAQILIDYYGEKMYYEDVLSTKL